VDGDLEYYANDPGHNGDQANRVSIARVALSSRMVSIRWRSAIQAVLEIGNKFLFMSFQSPGQPINARFSRMRTTSIGP
jgi:hypothetical protein